MSIQLELSKEEGELIKRWVEEHIPVTSYCMTLRAESVLRKLESAMR